MVTRRQVPKWLVQALAPDRWYVRAARPAWRAIAGLWSFAGARPWSAIGLYILGSVALFVLSGYARTIIPEHWGILPDRPLEAELTGDFLLGFFPFAARAVFRLA